MSQAVRIWWYTPCLLWKCRISSLEISEETHSCLHNPQNMQCIFCLMKIQLSWDTFKMTFSLSTLVSIPLFQHNEVTPQMKSNATLSCRHPARSEQRWPARGGWWWTLHRRDHNFLCGGWPARETLPVLHPDHRQYAMFWTCSSHSLQSITGPKGGMSRSALSHNAINLWSKSKAQDLADVPQLASSDPSSQSGVPSHSGFTLEMHLLFEHLYVKSVHLASESREVQKKMNSNRCSSLYTHEDMADAASWEN